MRLSYLLLKIVLDITVMVENIICCLIILNLNDLVNIVCSDGYYYNIHNIINKLS